MHCKFWWDDFSVQKYLIHHTGCENSEITQETPELHHQNTKICKCQNINFFKEFELSVECAGFGRKIEWWGVGVLQVERILWLHLSQSLRL